MISRSITAVTRLAVRLTGMIENSILPVACIVALGTLTTIVTRRPKTDVTGLAIFGTNHLMVETGLHPIDMIMAGNTLVPIMINRPVVLVARYAI